MHVLKNSFSLELSNHVEILISKYKQDRVDKPELGGVLLGLSENNRFKIVRASEPNSFDKSTRHTIDRNREIDQILIRYEEANSSGKVIYLGEWHTHPQDIPKISNQDQQMMRMRLKLSKLQLPRVFLAIQGIYQLGIWTFEGTKTTELTYSPLNHEWVENY